MNSEQREEVAMLDAAMLQAVDSMAHGLAKAAALNRRTCIHCMYFSEKHGEVCNAAHPPVKPPARIIAFGCPKFDFIPF